MVKKVARKDYETIIREQSQGKLILRIDTAAWRDFLVKVDPVKLNPLLSRPVTYELALIRLLSRGDILLLLACAGFSVRAFGWWSALIGPVFVVGGLFYKGHASIGRQSIAGVGTLLLLAIALCIYIDTWSVSVKIFTVCAAAVIFLMRFLYYFTSKFVFKNIESSYEFFAKFYLKPAEQVGTVEIPFIWTTPEFEVEANG